MVLQHPILLPSGFTVSHGCQENSHYTSDNLTKISGDEDIPPSARVAKL